MTYPILNAKMLTLQEDEILVIKFDSKVSEFEATEFSGEMRISYDIKFLSKKRIKEIQKVLAIIAQFVTEYYIK